MVLPLKVKHQSKVHELEVDPESTGEEMKMQLFSLTNVEPQNQKIIAGGKMVKDETLLSSLKLKPGATITLIGNPSADIVTEAPKERVKFAEDMTDAELAQQEGATPSGLQNTGNTCYANATLQTLRLMPELQEQMKTHTPSGTPSSAGPSASSLFSAEQLSQYGLGGLGGGSDLTSALRDLYHQMGQTTESFPPIMFLTTLRQKFPQFAERAKNGHGYAQQDAEEVWTQLVQTLHQELKLKDGEESSNFSSWVEKYMGGTFVTKTTCDEAPEEEPVIGQDMFNDLKCNISNEVYHLREGLSIGLNEQIEKQSPSLGRNAMYTKQSRISRMPKYLPIHFVRFFWRKDTGKKAKILKKVSFQHEIDILEFCTEELKAKVVPVRDQIREVRKEEEDVERAKKRQKRMRKDAEDHAAVTGTAQENGGSSKDQEMKDGETEVFKTDAEIDAERAESIRKAKEDLLNAVNPELAKDTAANQTGLYELRGVITHQGSSADSGHYTAYVKKSAKDGRAEDGKWWWFDDHKVHEVEAEKIETLAGGGETHSALILLYRAVELPKPN
ncbi:ubiquitin carboxyl-terminal hydrolase 14 [Polychaeton citri CBS 116435]|uniref:Ubiquitin carboxyl-terminal hydrolase n=1 Tax=Polychaeton citri CBS 116435 TaxID=1314669 RepID=A0A9P4Q602_9PEZI|nr:ubiquitin carboxyl-terminal hydrolase 14 [Polychaeton citri CBS 116435]